MILSGKSSFAFNITVDEDDDRKVAEPPVVDGKVLSCSFDSGRMCI